MKTTAYWAAALAVLTAVAGLQPARAAEGSIATVNGEGIAWGEFDKDWQAFVDAQKKAMKPEQMTPEWEKSRKEMLLGKLIEQRLILQAAQKKKIEVKGKDLEAAVERVKAHFKVDAQGQAVNAEAAEKAFKAELGAEGLTEKKFRENVADQLRAVALTDAVIKERVKAPTEADLKKVFGEVKDRMAHPSTGTFTSDRHQAEIEALARDLKLKSEERVQLQYILFRVDADASAEHRDAELLQAKEVKEKLSKGANFADMARQYSDDATSGSKGGEAGYIARGELQDKELSDAIFALPVGGISDVMKVKLGYELFRIEEKRAAADLRFEGVKKYLSDNLVRFAAQAEWADYVKGLRKAATVEVKADFAKPASNN